MQGHSLLGNYTTTANAVGFNAARSSGADATGITCYAVFFCFERWRRGLFYIAHSASYGNKFRRNEMPWATLALVRKNFAFCDNLI